MVRRTTADRTAELGEVFARRLAARVTGDLTEEVRAEFDRNPLGPHTDKTARVRRALGSMTIDGKQLIVSMGADGPWAIGVVTVGEPGNLVIDPEPFDHYEDAMRTIFASRARQIAGIAGAEGTLHDR